MKRLSVHEKEKLRVELRRKLRRQTASHGGRKFMRSQSVRGPTQFVTTQNRRKLRQRASWLQKQQQSPRSLSVKPVRHEKPCHRPGCKQVNGPNRHYCVRCGKRLRYSTRQLLNE